MKEIYLICNAHLDPVWQWEWEEGAAEALSTFRIAAKFCREYDGFVFNHNEAILYKWVEEYEPELFEEIQELVKAGKWHIMCGWHLQPDCNMPSGEAFVRQIQAGRKYFKEKFDVYPTTAINFDPFGHNRGLVQIMNKCGYDSYMFMRPYPSELELPGECFKWMGFDGSYVYARRTGAYNSRKGRAVEKIQYIIDACEEDGYDMCLWGVGNHGGGPSKKDLDMISELQKECEKNNIRLMHSTPEEYFERVDKDALPEYYGELNPCQVGCYTSTVRVKQQYRALENVLFVTEAMCAAASANGLMEYPDKELNEAIYDLITVQFHDMLPGSSVQPAEEMCLRQLSHGMEILSRVKMRAFLALSTGQKPAEEDKIPIMIFNPYPYKLEGDFECEMMLWDQNWEDNFSYPIVYKDGEKIPCQSEKERSTFNLDWRKRVVFHTTLEPMQMNRFDCAYERIPKRPQAVVENDGEFFYLTNKRVKAKISKKTGFLESYVVKGVEMLEGACELQVYDDDYDPWGMKVRSFPDKIGVFAPMTAEEVKDFSSVSGLEPVHPIESGSVRKTVEALVKYKNSKAVLQYTLSEFSDEIKVSLRIMWSESQKMAKFSVNGKIDNGRCFGQVAYGVQEFTENVRENCSQKYVYMSNGKERLGVVNNGTYGFSKIDSSMFITLLRSAVYCAHPIDGRETMPKDRYVPHMEQGERYFELLISGGKKEKIECELPRLAEHFNKRPMSVSVYPNSREKKVENFFASEGDPVEISAIKRADDGDGYIVRVFNPFDRTASVRLNFNIFKKSVNLTLSAFEVKTVRVNDDNFECDLLENKL